MADIHGSPADGAQAGVSQFSIQAPYDPGTISPVMTGCDDDAGGRDPVSGTVDGAEAAASARLAELQSDVGQGSTIGDLMDLAPVDSSASVATWGPYTPQQPPSGSFT